MHEEPSSNQHYANPLVKEVAGHLFTFEEKIFGITLTQLLMDLGVFTGSFSFTSTLPLLARLIVCALVTLGAMILIHGKVQGVTLGYWLYLLLRFHLLPKSTVWRPQISFRWLIFLRHPGWMCGQTYCRFRQARRSATCAPLPSPAMGIIYPAVG